MTEKLVEVLRKCWVWVFVATMLKPARRSSLIVTEQPFVEMFGPSVRFGVRWLPDRSPFR